MRRSRASAGACPGRSRTSPRSPRPRRRAGPRWRRACARLPRFLRELRLTMADARRAGRGDDAGGLGPRRRRARPQPHRGGARALLQRRHPGARRRWARRGRRGIPALQASLPVVKDTRALAKSRAAGRARRSPTCSRRSSATTASSARWTSSSTASPPSTASTRSATTCAPALIVNQCTSYAVAPGAGLLGELPAPSARRARPRPASEPVAATATPAPRGRDARRAQPRPAGAEAEPLLDYLFGSDG